MPTYNKIVVNGEEILNLDNDTVSSTNQVMNGVTFHLNDGSSAVGSGTIADEYSIGGSLTSDETCSYKISDSATSIIANRFQNYTNLTGIIAPNVETIGNNAFYRCTGLAGELSLPQATSIGNNAFYGCSGLTSASLPQATSIGERAFYNCTGLAGELSLPQATSIGYSAFTSCSGLTSISLPVATSIGGCAFLHCTGLTGELSLPQATTIGDSAFNSCSGLTSVSLPQATSIGNNAFQVCSGLTGELSLPQATSIGYSAFYRCSGLTSVSLPQATSIGYSAFCGCTNLTSITIKNGVVYVPNSGGPYKIATFNNHLYWQDGTTTNKIYVSDAVAGEPTTTLIGTLTTSNPSFIYIDGPYTITFTRTGGTYNRFSISWTETP